MDFRAAFVRLPSRHHFKPKAQMLPLLQLTTHHYLDDHRLVCLPSLHCNCWQFHGMKRPLVLNQGELSNRRTIELFLINNIQLLLHHRCLKGSETME